jgi:HAD superfamily hydrolase (TIGR01509 family)
VSELNHQRAKPVNRAGRKMGRAGKWGVIFDVDGTMVDNSRFHEMAWIEIGRRYNLPITSEFYYQRIHSRSGADIAGDLFSQRCGRRLAEEIIREKEIVYRRMFRPVIKEVPGLGRLLAELYRADVPCAVASNSPTESVDMVLEALRIKQYFAVVIDYTQIERSKPDPEIFLKAAAQMGVSPGRCVVIEDSWAGFEAARRAEMAYVVVNAVAAAKEATYIVYAKAVCVDFTAVRLSDLARFAGEGPGNRRC